MKDNKEYQQLTENIVKFLNRGDIDEPYVTRNGEKTY